MRKPLLVVWFLSLLILSAGTVLYPNNPAFWLASGSTVILYIRGLLAALLMFQLLTQPPRNIWFRLFAGTVAASVAIWSIQATLGFDIKLLDGLAFLGSSLAIGLTALERESQPAEEKATPSRPHPVRS